MGDFPLCQLLHSPPTRKAEQDCGVDAHQHAHQGKEESCQGSDEGNIVISVVRKLKLHRYWCRFSFVWSRQVAGFLSLDLCVLLDAVLYVLSRVNLTIM